MKKADLICSCVTVRFEYKCMNNIFKHLTLPEKLFGSIRYFGKTDSYEIVVISPSLKGYINNECYWKSKSE